MLKEWLTRSLIDLSTQVIRDTTRRASLAQIKPRGKIKIRICCRLDSAKRRSIWLIDDIHRVNSRIKSQYLSTERQRLVKSESANAFAFEMTFFDSDFLGFVQMRTLDHRSTISRDHYSGELLRELSFPVRREGASARINARKCPLIKRALRARSLTGDR